MQKKEKKLERRSKLIRLFFIASFFFNLVKKKTKGNMAEWLKALAC